MDGNKKITVIILMIAPLAISAHIWLIKAILEYTDTPNVDVKNPSALTRMDGIDACTAISIASLFACPAIRSVLYLVDNKIA